MHIEFTNTLEDLKESLVPEKFAAKPEAYKREFKAIWVVWPVMLGMMILAKLSPLRTDRTLDPELPHQDLVPILLCSIVPAALLTIANFAAIWRSWQAARPNAKPLGSRRSRAWFIELLGLCWVLTGAAMIATLTDFNTSHFWAPTRFQLMLLATAPWVAFITADQLNGWLRRRWAAATQWFSNPGATRPSSMDINDQHLTVADDVVQITCRWSAFVRARETENLFILIWGSGRSLLIPKRAFAGPAELGAMRSLIQTKVQNCQLLVSPIGFEVLPLHFQSAANVRENA